MHSGSKVRTMEKNSKSRKVKKSKSGSKTRKVEKSEKSKVAAKVEKSEKSKSGSKIRKVKKPQIFKFQGTSSKIKVCFVECSWFMIPPHPSKCYKMFIAKSWCLPKSDFIICYKMIIGFVLGSRFFATKWRLVFIILKSLKKTCYKMTIRVFATKWISWVLFCFLPDVRMVVL